MLSTTELLSLYRAERSALEFPSEPFQPFGEWRSKYKIEYNKNHISVDVKVALAEADQIVEQADAELAQPKERKMESVQPVVSTNVLPPSEGPFLHSGESLPVEDKRLAKNARRRAARAAAKAKKLAKKPIKVNNAGKRGVNKTAVAREIFTKNYGKVARAEVIVLFVKAGLTANGASTYYQKFKKEVA